MNEVIIIKSIYIFQACRSENMDTVSQKLKHKLSLRPPPKILVEKYLIEISKNYNVPYEPDLQVRKRTVVTYCDHSRTEIKY